MKILLLAAIIALTFGAAQMIEVSGFKTADQLLNDIQSDTDNVYGIIFFKRDDSNFELTKRNKETLEKLKTTADNIAKKVTAATPKYIYFARVDMSVKDNSKLWEKFGLKADSCDKFPAGSITKGAAGKKIDGPAIVSLFEKNLKDAAGLGEAV
jgi:hypothetical protein